MRLGIALVLAGCTAVPATADAAVRRCIGPEGDILYTDRPCDQFNAREQATAPSATEAPAAVAEPASGPIRSDCARSPDSLLFDLRRAVESSDVNALSGLYHWPGTGARAAVSIMDRLEDLTAEPGAAVDLVYPEAAFVVDDPSAYPDLPAEDPLGVRVTRYVDADSGAAPERMLQLTRYAGCWWIHF